MPSGVNVPSYLAAENRFDPSAVETRDGTRAIEVHALFEDAIIAVAHLENPDAGRITRATKALLAFATGALSLSAIACIAAYIEVGRIHLAWEAWDRSGRAHRDFIVPRDSSPLDTVAMILLVAGIGALIQGLLRLFSERGPRDFTIGSDPKAQLNAPFTHLPLASFPLVHSTGSDFELLFTREMAGEIDVDGEAASLAQLIESGRARPSLDVSGAFAWPIPEHARAQIDLVHNTFLIASVAPPRRYDSATPIDWATQAYTGATGLVVLLFLILVHAIPEDLKTLSLDAFTRDQRFVQLLIKAPEEAQPPLPDWLQKRPSDAAGGKGQRRRGEEGMLGKKSSPNRVGIYAIKGPKDNVDPHLAKLLAEAEAHKAGILGLFKTSEGTQMASVFGRDTALGNDADDVMGTLVGHEIGEAYGNGGYGVVGSGKGGGGSGDDTIGIGELGRIGKGGGGGNRSGYGRGVGLLGGHRATVPDIVPGTAQVRGSLDKEIIRRVIRRHLQEVKFCYEKELMRHDGLVGRVLSQFTINGHGQVIASTVQSSTLNSPQVEQCIAQAVRRWEFPQPEGGGIVVVSYPFVLKAAGAE